MHFRSGLQANTNSILVKLSICARIPANQAILPTIISPTIGGTVIRKRTSSSTSTADVDKLARAFKALSNPNRLSIYLEVLRQYRTEMKSCGLSHLIDSLAIGAPTISHHTKELVDAGLISVQRDGRFIRCTLDDEMRDKLSAFFGKDSE